MKKPPKRIGYAVHRWEISGRKLNFGRVIVRDPRDKAYPMAAVVPKTTARVRRYWFDDYWWGDQAQTPQCVAYAWTHWLHDSPIVPTGTAVPAVDPSKLYDLARNRDEWPGEDYEGTSVRGAAKALVTLRYVGAYHWARTVATVARAVLEVGPVVVGTDWTYGMCYPHADGTLDITGDVVGGHAYLLNGCDTKAERFRIKQSWGRDWGKDGHAYIRFADLEKLLKRDGEACLATEIGKPADRLADRTRRK